MSKQELDLTQSSYCDIEINRNRSLDLNITAQFYSGSTLLDFDFSAYTGATLQVRIRPDASNVVLEFSTDDNSIQLPTIGNIFKLKKTAEELLAIRAGEYYYDMYLSSALYPKRAFLYGKIKIYNYIST